MKNIKTILVRGCQLLTDDNTNNMFQDRLNKKLKNIKPEDLIDIKFNHMVHPELKPEILFTALIIYKE